MSLLCRTGQHDVPATQCPCRGVLDLPAGLRSWVEDNLDRIALL